MEQVYSILTYLYDSRQSNLIKDRSSGVPAQETLFILLVPAAVKLIPLQTEWSN